MTLQIAGFCSAEERDVRHFSDSASWRAVNISGNKAYVHLSP